jgi:hypothetical protein
MVAGENVNLMSDAGVDGSLDGAIACLLPAHRASSIRPYGGAAV